MHNKGDNRGMLIVTLHFVKGKKNRMLSSINYPTNTVILIPEKIYSLLFSCINLEMLIYMHTRTCIL